MHACLVLCVFASMCVNSCYCGLLQVVVSCAIEQLGSIAVLYKNLLYAYLNTVKVVNIADISDVSKTSFMLMVMYICNTCV